MNNDDDVCLCFHVSKRKIVNFCKRQRPVVASLIGECLSAGTGCQWCVPFLRKLHQQVIEGAANPDLPITPKDYAKRRSQYRKTGHRKSEE